MKKIFIISIVLLFTTQYVVGQKLSDIDKKKIKNEKDKIENLKKGSNNEVAISNSYQFIAFTYQSNGMYDEAMQYFTEALNATSNIVNLRSNNSNIGELLIKKGKLEEGQNYNLKALEYAKLTKNNQVIFNTKIKIAQTYGKLYKYTDAVTYYESSLVNAKKIGKTNKMKISLKGLSSSYSKTNEFDKLNIVNSLLSNTGLLPADLDVLINYGKPVVIIEAPQKEVQNIVYQMVNNEGFKDSIYNIFNEKQKRIIDSISVIEKAIQADLELTKKDLAKKRNVVSKLALVVEQQKNALIIFGSLLLIIIVLTIIIFVELKKNKKQNKILAKQKQEIQLQAAELNEKNQELETTLDNLKTAQSQLIQSEKMASLGKLVANIAHELNTPLGAINSSISTLDSTSNNVFEMLPKYIQTSSSQEFELLIELIKLAETNNDYISSREARKLKKNIKKQLDKLGVEDYNYVAGILVEVGVHNDFEKFVPIFKKNPIEPPMETIYNMAINSKIRQNIKTAIEKASKIIYALKNYSRSTSSEIKIEADIRKSLDSVLTIYQNQLKQGINVTKNYSDIPIVMCYPDDIGQVWTNIIHNAVQAMKGKGELDIIVGLENNNISVSFKDTGVGIPDEIKDKIFMPFFTTKPEGEGTGLGLDIVMQIIKKHNGQISFESEVGKGTTFNVLIPIN